MRQYFTNKYTKERRLIGFAEAQKRLDPRPLPDDGESAEGSGTDAKVEKPDESAKRLVSEVQSAPNGQAAGRLAVNATKLQGAAVDKANTGARENVETSRAAKLAAANTEKAFLTSGNSDSQENAARQVKLDSYEADLKQYEDLYAASAPDISPTATDQELPPDLQILAVRILEIIARVPQIDVRSVEVQDLITPKIELEKIIQDTTQLTQSFNNSRVPPEIRSDLFPKLFAAKDQAVKNLEYVEKRIALRETLVAEGRKIVGENIIAKYTGQPVSSEGTIVQFALHDNVWSWHYSNKPLSRVSPRFIPEPSFGSGNPEVVPEDNLPYLPNDNKAFSALRPVMQELAELNSGKYDQGSIDVHNGDTINTERLLALQKNDDPLWA